MKRSLVCPTKGFLDPEYDTIQRLLYISMDGGFDGWIHKNRNPGGSLFVRYLYFNEERWNWNYNWLDNDWNQNNPAAVLANPPHSSAALFAAEVLYSVFLIHPPSILPISFRGSESAIYFLLSKVLSSHAICRKNLTSQLLVNIYMNEFDQFVKHRLQVKYYIRYADDFVVLSRNREWLEAQITEIARFLYDELKLDLHPQKVAIGTLASGVDFLGWIHFPDHRVLRTAAKRRMIRKLAVSKSPASLYSYLGLLKHGNTEKIREKILSGVNV